MPLKSKAEAIRSLTELGGNLRNASNLVFRCTRALILSHFDTAEERPADKHRRQYYGALYPLLNVRLDDEGVSQEEWDVFKLIWANLSKGMQLTEGPEAVTVDGKRTRRGAYAHGWPGIFAIADALLGDTLSRSLLTDWYRANLCRRYKITDSPEFIAFASEWLERFNSIDVPAFRRKDLLVLVPAEEDQHALWGEGLVEALDYLALLQFARRDLRTYALKFKADLGFILTNLFGRSTGIDGLDYLLFGGLSIPEEKLSIVISGAPGMGKSTLALAMATQVAARGGLCLFFRFEQMEGVIRRQMAQFHRNLLPYFNVTSQSENLGGDLEESGVEHASDGLVAISDIANMSIEEIQSSALRLANSPQAKRFSEQLVVFDSISAAFGYGKDVDVWRKFIVDTSAVLRAMGYVVVFLVERTSSDEVSFEDYVADVDIRLGLQAGDACSYPFRVLEIKKSRWQPSHRGQHVYSIEANSGMNVYPSSAAIMAARRKREARVKYSENSLINPGVKNFVTYLNGPRNRIATDTHEVAWWRKGSVTALIGARGSLKTVFAHTFSVTPDRDSAVTECSLSIHFADEFHRTGLLRENQRPSAFGVRYDIPLGTAVRDSLGSTLTYVLFRPGFLASGHVLQTVREIIAEKRKSQTPIRRAVISDASNVAPDFPALKDDQAFLPALCDLLTSEGITTIIVYSWPEHGGQDFVIDQVRGAAENILRCESISHAGRVYSSISVERSADSSHDHGVYEIRKWRHGKLHDEIEVAPTFDLVLDLKAGTPKVAKVKVLLDAGRTELQRKFHSQIKQFYKGIGAYDVSVLDHVTAFTRQGGVGHVTAVERALWLIQVEASDLPFAKSKHGRDSVLSDLSLFTEHMHALSKELAYALTASDRTERRSSGMPVRSIPYYLNPSFLVIRSEFRDFALKHERWRNVGIGLGDYSWRDLIAAASEFRARSAKWKDHVLFDFPAFASEALNCLFLEVLQSLLKRSLMADSFPAYFDPDGPLMHGEGALRETLTILRELAQEAYDKYYSPGANHSGDENTADDNKTHARKTRGRISKSIIWRHWYSSFRQMAADMAAGSGQLNPGLSLLRLPGNVWTNGDWHLGILEGSVGVRQGVEIILDKFVNRPNSMLLMTQGVGLPPFKDFYLDDGSLLVTGVPPNWFLPYVRGENVICRSLLSNYNKIAPLLRYYLASMVRDGCTDKNALDNSLKDRFLSMHKIFERAIAG